MVMTYLKQDCKISNRRPQYYETETYPIELPKELVF